MNLQDVINAPGFGSGKKARDILNARAERRSHVPERHYMNELLVANEIDGLVATLGNDPEDGKDYHLNTSGYALTGDASTAGEDARAIAAIWNAYRDGELVWADQVAQEIDRAKDAYDYGDKAGRRAIGALCHVKVAVGSLSEGDQ